MLGVVGDVEVDYVFPLVASLVLKVGETGAVDGELMEDVDGVLLGNGPVEVEDYEASHSLGMGLELAGYGSMSGFPEGHRNWSEVIFRVR